MVSGRKFYVSDRSGFGIHCLAAIDWQNGLEEAEVDIFFEQLNPHSCKTYLFGAKGSSEAVIVDPVLEHFPDYIKLLKQRALKLTHVIDTHTHADHISGAAALKDLAGCEYLMHENSPSGCVSVRLKDGDEIELAQIPIKVIYTPGHTEDAICLVLQDRLLTGDTLFLDEGGAGRDDLPGGDPSKHWESLQKIMQLPEYLVVYPAHDYRGRQPSSLSVQKQTNPHLRIRTKAEFIEYIEDLKLGPADWMKEVLKANYACARDPRAAWVPVDAPACEVKGTLGHGVNDLPVELIPAEDLKNLLDAGADPLLLDVREAAELTGELGHLKNIRHIPIASLSSRLSELDPEIGREIITICRSGARASTAAQILKQAGFEHVKVLEGGMLAWRKLGA